MGVRRNGLGMVDAILVCESAVSRWYIIHTGQGEGEEEEGMRSLKLACLYS